MFKIHFHKLYKINKFTIILYFLDKQIDLNLNPIVFFRLNLRVSDIPKCTPICTDPLPKAPDHTDLELKYVIPKSNPEELRNLTNYGSEAKPMYSGDRLVYDCKTPYWVRELHICINSLCIPLCMK